MTTTNATARRAAAPTRPRRSDACDTATRPGAGLDFDASRALVRHWLELPRTTTTERHERLEAIRIAVRNGELSPAQLVPFALGDVDPDIVALATVAYVAAGPTSIERRTAAVDDVVEWIRRDLGFHRAALFAALLSIGDAAIEERLRGLRLSLDETQAAQVSRRCACSPHASVRDFLAEWRELAAAQ